MRSYADRIGTFAVSWRKRGKSGVAPIPTFIAMQIARSNRSTANRAHDEPPSNARDLYGRENYDTLDFHYRAAFHGIDTG